MEPQTNLQPPAFESTPAPYQSPTDTPTPQPKPHVWLYAGSVYVVLLLITAVIVGAVLLPKKTTVSLIAEVNNTKYETDQTVSPRDHVVLGWKTTNAEDCTLQKDNTEPVPVRTNNQETGIQKWLKRNDISTPDIPNIPRIGNMPPIQRMAAATTLDLVPGTTVTYTLTCDGVSETRTITVRELLLSDYELAENRWYTKLAIQDIPTNAYRAYYFDSTNPTQILHTEEVPNVSFEGSGYSLYQLGINTEHLGIYWIGSIQIPATGKYSLVLDSSWGDARVIIEGREIDNLEEAILTLEAGRYQVEVEYLSREHISGLQFILTPYAPTLSRSELLETIQITGGTYDLWVVDTYNDAVPLMIDTPAARPTILALNSHEPTAWNIPQTAGKNIAYIMYSSDQPGSTVTTDLSPSRVFKVAKGVLPEPDGYGQAKIEAQCWTDDYPPRCDNVTTISRLNDFARELGGGTLTGFTSPYDGQTDTMSIPANTLDPASIDAIQAKNNAIKTTAEAEAKRGADTSVETLFAD